MPPDPLRLDLRLRRGSFELNVQTELAGTGITALTGPSGAGKSTLLRLIAGLDRPDRGHIRLAEETWTDSAGGRHLPAHARPVGLVFQDSRLFSHLSVAGNLAYAERRRPALRDSVPFGQVVETLDLAPLLDRRPASLSGGEQRRVALGRTLLAGPRWLLLDEPLTGLDRDRKRVILNYIERVNRRFALPMLYVSHDLADIARLADWLWVLEGGQLARAGPADAVLLDWSGVETGHGGARLVARVTCHVPASGLTRLCIGDTTIDAPLDTRLAAGDRVRLWVRARDVAIAVGRPTGLSIRNILPVTIIDAAPSTEGHDVTLTLAFGDQRLKARISRASYADLGLVSGQSVFALLKTVRLEAGGL